MAETRLKINNLWYEHRGQATLRGINLAVPGGEGAALLDPTGLSSADLLQICATLLQPTQGEIHLEGKPILFDREIDLLAMRRKIAYFSWATALISNLTLLQNISLGWAYHHNRSMHDTWEEGEKFLNYFRIHDYRNMRPTEVSAEVSRRTMCARELSKNPVLILVDSVIESLSPEGQNLFISRVEKYMRETGSSLLLASSSPVSLALLASLTTRTCTLENGKIVEENPDRRDNI